jgi:hypothetical protein
MINSQSIIQEEVIDENPSTLPEPETKQQDGSIESLGYDHLDA